MPKFLPASLCLAALLVSAAGGAQPGSTPSAPSSASNSAPSSAPDPIVAPPIAQTGTDVPYPAGGEGDAAVLLELVIEADGVVSRALVVEGSPPFAEHARTAALRWRFTPAQRDGKAAAVRIRARVDFHDTAGAPRAVVASPPPLATHADAAEQPREPVADTGPAAEITVVGARREIGQTTLSKSDVREMPGAFGDAFRAIEALPGVTPLASGVPYFYVRGAPPNNSGYYVDGIRVPLLFHLGLGQSVIHPGLVDHVDFFPSAASARYGGFAGAVIAGHTREPASELRGEANLRLVDVGALVETPFAEGRGSVLVAGRYGYPGLVLAAVTDDLQIGYWDYQARASWQLSAASSISLLGFGSHDYLASRSPSGDPEASQEMIEQMVSDFHRLDLRYDVRLPGGRLRVALTGGHDRQGAEPTYVTNHSLAARVEFDHQLAPTLLLRSGLHAQLDHYDLTVTRQGPGEPVVPQSADPPPTNLSGGLNADVVWRAAPRVELVPGVRVDVYGSSRRREAPATGRARTLLPAVDPRLSARVLVAPRVAWLSALGLAHQYPSLRLGSVPAPILSVPGFPFDDPGLQNAAQASQGFEFALPAELALTVTGFYSHFWGLTDLSASCFQRQLGNEPETAPGDPVPPYICPNNRPVRGRAFGVEVLLRRAFTERLGGWLSYTLSRATRQARFYTPSGEEDLANVASEFDRTHVFNAVLSYALGLGWRAGARFMLYTGTPYSQLDGSIPVPPYNAYRNPAFYRVDVRLEKRWQLSERTAVAFVLEGQNVTLSKEVSNLGLDCEGTPMNETQTTTCKQTTMGPLTLPSIGVEAFF